MSPQPNILLLVLDEFRSPPVYEPKEIKRFCSKEFSGLNYFKEHGITFNHHYTGSSACVPSRGVLYTGHYPSLTKVRSTSGGAKDHTDPGLAWLEPDAVPTMGTWFQEAGYETKYVGKWHISYEDLLDDDGAIIFPYTGSIKSPDKKGIRKYQKADVLAKYGFGCGWVGPEPHGANEYSSGWLKDPIYVKEATDFLEQKEENAENGVEDKPWIMTVNLVNPHDIVFANPLGWYLKWFRKDRPSGWGGEGDKNFKAHSKVPRCPPSPTDSENLAAGGKPKAQQEFVKTYMKMFGGPLDQLFLSSEDYRRFYYWLLCVADRNVDALMNFFLKLPHVRENTIVVVTSDHGELLGAHGRLRQKWYNVYEEAMHIPLYMKIPRSMTESNLEGVHVNNLSCSVDILPTLLGFAGVNFDQISKKVKITHREVHTLPGRDWSHAILSGSIKENQDASLHHAQTSMKMSKKIEATDNHIYVNSLDEITVQDAIYMELADHVSRGDAQTRAISKTTPLLRKVFNFEYDSVQGPVCIDAVVLQIEFNNEYTARLKYAKYWDNPELWSKPFKEDIYKVRDKIRDPISGKIRGRGYVLVKEKQLPEEEELYDLILDPTETKNLAVYDLGSRLKFADSNGLVNIAVMCKKTKKSKMVLVESGILIQAVRNALENQKKIKMRHRNTPYYLKKRNVHPYGEWSLPTDLNVMMSIVALIPWILAILIGIQIF